LVDAVADTGKAAPFVSPVTPAYRKYALALLVAIYTVNFLDRQVVTTLIEPIKADLHLSDTQVGLMGGLYFAILYTVLGIPIARWADKGDRPLIMTLSLTVWSGFTLLAGFAQNFLTLAISRMGVGVGEAGCSPTAHSLLADYYPRDKRATALAIYSMGISIGTLLGMVIGGVVAQYWGWRPAFFVAGAPGLIFAVLALFSLVEPRRKLAKDARTKSNAANHIPMAQVMKVLSTKPTFWLFAFGGAFVAFVSYSHSYFLVSYFLRNHAAELSVVAAQFGMAPEPGKLPQAFTSTALGLAAGIGGGFGAWFGGFAADKLSERNIRNYMLFPTLIFFVSTPVMFWVLGTSNMMLAMFLMLIPNMAVAAWWGPVYGGVQGLVPPAMRAMSAAILLFIINMIGLGGGPTVFGMVTDYYSNQNLLGTGLDVQACKTAAADVAGTCAAAAAAGIKTTMYLSNAVLILAVICFFLTRGTVGKDMES